VDRIVDRTADRIQHSDIDDERVKDLVKRLLTDIRRAFRDHLGADRPGVCLVFVHDPSAPGGTEIERLIRTDPTIAHLARDMTRRMLSFASRYTGARQVVEVDESQWKPLAHAGAVVIVDSVSFTGQTLQLARDYLARVSGREKKSFTAAVLLLPRATYNLMKDGGPEATMLGGEIDDAERWWDVITCDKDYRGFEVTFPWGWTTATLPVAARSEQIEDPFLPQSTFSFVPKPWGKQLIFTADDRRQVSLLIFNAGQRTSHHYHVLRDETFVVLDSRVRICLWDRYIELRQHDSIRVPAGVAHSLIALDQPARVLEIAHGHYDLEGDIVRLSDMYGRVGT
jgi:mannose-6-phosphate isomerase-like protein (cupin superfamily)